MGDLAIRAFVGSDLEAVRRLAGATREAPQWQQAAYEALLPAAFVDDKLQNAAGVAEAAWVAEVEGRLVGFAAVRLLLGVCELESIVVDESQRRAGIGRALLATIAGWAREHRGLRIVLEVRAGNRAAIDFYQRAGFHVDGHRPRYYSTPEEDAILMSLELTTG
jgi:ribosomal-protein-alanine N-acetyltransferase